MVEEIRRRDAGETSGFAFALNLETRGRDNDRNLNRGRSKSRNSNRNRSKSRSCQQVQCWNCGKTGHLGGNAKVLRRRMKMILLILYRRDIGCITFCSR